MLTEKQVGERIAKARELAGYTQVSLAEHLGLAERTIQSWEQGDRSPRFGALQRLAGAVDKPASWFYEDHSGDKAAA